MTTELNGDYTARVTAAPGYGANARDFKSSPITVYPQSVIRLEVQFPTDIGSMIDPGEFVLMSVRVAFPSKPKKKVITPATTSERITKPKKHR